MLTDPEELVVRIELPRVEEVVEEEAVAEGTEERRPKVRPVQKRNRGDDKVSSLRDQIIMIPSFGLARRREVPESWDPRFAGSAKR